MSEYRVSESTGLGPLELFVLEALDRLAAHERQWIKSSTVASSVFEEHGVGPRYSYDVLCDLARPRVLHLRPVDFNVNYGSMDFEAASGKYTESRLSRLGAAALAAERQGGPALPIGLINGTTHIGGPTPPLSPKRVLAALGAAAGPATDEQLVALVGLPEFPTGCAVSGDTRQFASGAPTRLTLRASIEFAGRGLLLISTLPPGISNGDVSESLMLLGDEDPNFSGLIADVNDISTRATATRIECRLKSGVDPTTASRHLSEIWGLRVTKEVALGAPLPDLLRGWTSRFGTDGLRLLEQLQ